MNKNIFCWCHYDLDGLCSSLIVKWVHPDSKIEFKATTPQDFREDFLEWLVHHGIYNYDRIYIVDLDVLEHVDIIDKENIFVVDHHQKTPDTSKFQKATVIVKEYSSCAKLLYKVFKKMYNKEFTEKQKELIVITDDYDSYSLKIPISHDLNSVFWGTHNAFPVLMEYFKDGFCPLNEQQLSIARIHDIEVKEIIEKAIFFKCEEFPFAKKKYTVISTLANKHVNDVSDYIFAKFKPDVVFIVNTKSNRVNLRRRNDIDINLAKLAEKLCDGGGHEYSAGGVLTENFIEITKNFKPICQ